MEIQNHMVFYNTHGSNEGRDHTDFRMRMRIEMKIKCEKGSNEKRNKRPWMDTLALAYNQNNI